MKNIVVRTFVMASLISVLSGVSAQARTARIQFKIPFDFVAGKARLRAGSYSVRQVSSTTWAIRSDDGKTATLVNAPLTIFSKDATEGARLGFNRYGDEYFLAELWLRADVGRQLYPSESELRTAKEQRLNEPLASRQRIAVAANIDK